MDKALQVRPNREDYLLQSHQISRAAYLLPVMQRRLLHLVMCQVQRLGDTGDSDPVIAMDVGDVVRALQMDDSGKSYEAVRDATRGLHQYVLDIDTVDGWAQYGWINWVKFNRSKSKLTMQIAADLVPFILEIGQLWTKIPVADLTKLQGKYAYRLFELVMANKGFSGKGGNKPGEWFTDLEFGDLRALLKMGPNEYPRTETFRRKIIDTPLREINEAGLGLELTADYDFFRRGRTLRGVRILAHLLRADEPRNVTPTPEDNEDDELIKLNQKLYDQLLSEEPKDMFGGELKRIANAFEALKRHPDCKKVPPKRSRKGGKE